MSPHQHLDGPFRSQITISEHLYTERDMQKAETRKVDRQSSSLSSRETLNHYFRDNLINYYHLLMSLIIV